MSMSIKALIICSVSASALLSSGAVAQSQPDEIIVTAQKREQALQDVPVAISAFGASELSAKRITNVDQLSGIAPNLTIEAGNTTSSGIQVAIRGSVTSNVTTGEDPAVGIYLDGVYVGKGAGAVFDIVDLERVEVLRGPQGALFGRNTLAGAISLVTRKPSDQLRIEGELTYGNYNYMASRALVNLPLTDRFFVKVSGQFQVRDGFTKLSADPLGFFPTAQGDMDDLNRYSVLAQARWLPTDNLTIDYSYHLSRTNEHPLSALSGVGAGNIFDPASPVYIPTMPANLYVVPGKNRPKKIAVDHRSIDKSKVYSHSLNMELDLGDAALRSISSYRDVSIDQGNLGLDVDGTPMPLALGGFKIDISQYSQEFQLVGRALDSRLNYVAGAYYLKDNGQSHNPQEYFFGASAFDTSYGVRTRAYALYANVDYEVADGLTLTGGLRWTKERKHANRFYQILAVTPNPGLVLPYTVIDIRKADKVQKSFSNLSPTAIIAYEVNPDLNLYAKYAVGFRSGGFNVEATTDQDVRTAYNPEKNESFELGVKSRFLDRRVQLNVAAFYNRQKDKQVPVFLAAGTAATIYRNAGRAKVYGLEAELNVQPVDALKLYGSLGLLRTKYQTYSDTSITGVVENVADNRFFAKAPKTTLTVGGDLTLADTDSAGRFIFSGDVRYQSKVFALPGQRHLDPNFPLVATGAELGVPSLTVANARLRWEADQISPGAPQLYAMLWVNNLTNYRKINNSLSFGPNFGGLVVSNYHAPRTYGLTLGFKY